MNTSQPTPSAIDRRRLTWQQASGIVLLTLAFGVAFNLWRPLFLAPPLLETTFLIYTACSLAWLPVLIVCLLLKPIGPGRTFILLAVIGLLVACVGFTLQPATPIGGFLGAPLKCQVISHTNQLVQYKCVADRLFVIDTYIFEGPEGWPIVWLVSKKSTNL